MNIHAREPRLRLSAFGYYVTRVFGFISYAAIGFLAAAFFWWGNASLEWASVFLVLIFLDRIFRIGSGDRTITEVSRKGGSAAAALTPSGYACIDKAYRAVRSDSTLGFPSELFLVLLLKRDVREALRRFGLSAPDVARRFRELAKDDAPATLLDRAALIEAVESFIAASFDSALRSGERYIEPRSLFAALAASSDPALLRLFRTLDISAADAQEAVVFGRWRRSFSRLRSVPAVLGGFANRSRAVRHRTVNRSWTSRPTPTLDQYGTDLTDLARAEKAGFLIGHEKEFQSLLEVVARPGKPNAVLVGEPGAGKTTMIAHLAFRMVKDEVPSVLFDKRLVSLDIARLVADATPDEIAGRLQKIVREVLLAQNIVLHVPNMHDLFRTAHERGAINAIDGILPIVSSEAIPMIGETYPSEFKRYIEPRTDFTDQFQIVPVNEISETEAVQFLVYMGVLLERQFKVSITFPAIKRAVVIAHRYFSRKLLPGSAVDLLKQACAKAAASKPRVVDERIVAAVAETQTEVPIEAAGEAEAEKLLNLEDIIHRKLVNQEPAVRAVSQALREYRSGLSRRGGPIATFLFVGPTGVGKTELAKILAEVQFGSRSAMERFDMSEYQDKASIFRLIGTPDGERTGSLTDAVLAKPYSLVLLDEFEKAHPSILNLFLQVFDDGRLTDGLGRTVSFENTIIIATSNAHSDYIKSEIEAGRPAEEIAEALKKKLTTYFKPELINRFSSVTVFRSLTEGEIRTVAGFLVKDVADSLMDSHGISAVFDAAAVAEIARIGYSPVFGARPLREAISQHIKAPLANKILRREFARGAKLAVSFRDGQFTFDSSS